MFCKTKSEEKNIFLWRDFRQFSNKNVHIWDHFFPLLFPKDSESVKILDIQLREVGAKRPLKKTENRRRSKKVKKVEKKKLFFVTRFSTIFKQKCSYLRPLLSSTFPQGFRISKNIRHLTSGSGGKMRLKIYHAKRDKHTYIQLTSRLLDRIGPVGRFDENVYKLDVKLSF